MPDDDDLRLEIGLTVFDGRWVVGVNIFNPLFGRAYQMIPSVVLTEEIVACDDLVDVLNA